MINKMINDAKKSKADPFIVITHTQDKKKNPLTIEEKKKILSTMYPNVPVLATSKNEPNPKYIVKKLKEKKYTNIAMMVGSDRAKSFGWVGIPVLSGGKRNNSSGASGMSATKAREAAVIGNINVFRKSVDPKLSNNNVENLMKTIKNRMK